MKLRVHRKKQFFVLSSHQYVYDACGRLIAVESSAGVTSLSWDYEDRLVGITYPNQSTNSFGYNGFGARVSKIDSTGNYTFLRGGTSVVSPVLDDGSAAYTPGISERRNNASRFYTLNAQGSTTQLTDSSQEEAASFSYDAWGNRIGTRNSDDPPFLFGGGFGYETDPDTGLVWVGAFPYLPDIGRFIVRGGGGFAYGGGYAPDGNNPVVSPGGGSAGGSSSGGGPSGPQIAPLEMVWVDPGVPGIGTLYKPWCQHGLDFGWDGLIGIGDMASWGLTRCLRQSLGLDEYVDYDSPGYKYAPWAYMLVGGWANGVRKGISNAISSSQSPSTVPVRARLMKDYVLENGSPPKGYQGCKPFKNREGRLPAGKFKEYDIDPKPPRRKRRGPERIVVGDDGTAYYTPDHYENFIPF